MVKDARQQFEKRLKALVEKFSQREDEFKRADYSELQARIDFIDPFFEALGWDVRNAQHQSEREREVVVESGQTSGRPDYNFRLNGQTQFFVEAKAPHVPLDNSRVILQAKKYAFNETSQTVVLAAATDFEEFRLYEVRDISYLRHANKGLVFAYRYDEYLTPKALDDLWKLSREAVAAGSLDALVTTTTRRTRQRVSLDQQFLADLAEWRERLAKAVFKDYPALDARDLNNIVQVFLDRLIFIRVAEDRGVLPEGQLIEIARHWRQSEQSKPVIAELFPLFRTVNRALNGEIFKPHRCEEIEWDSALVAEIIDDGLEPYNFAQIGVEMLGSIYERYLGKTIRVTATRAIVEDKPEVRKAGGVYYTPKYIVDYIVAQTVGKLIEGKTPKQIEKLKILDPACGSGSFLLAAYQTLLDYHTRYFAERASRRGGGGGGGGNGGQAFLLREPQAEYGEFKLSLEQKAAILRNNIFGVDIDPQAVEITMMSLYIKMLEGERGAIVGQGILPPLKDNIKCGNSLIGYDIGALPDDDKARINPFDWNSASEGFGEIMAAGGFDAVIGNPPYGADLTEEAREYLSQKFKVGTTDTAALFMIQATRLVTSKGWNGLIIPKPLAYSSNWEEVRGLLLPELQELVDVGKVWKEVKLEQMIYFLQRRQVVAQYRSLQRVNQEFDYLADITKTDCARFGFYLNGVSQAELDVARKILAAGQFLVDFATNVRGGMFQSSVSDRRKGKRVIGGKQVQRYAFAGEKGYIQSDTTLPPNAFVKEGNLLVQNIVAHIANPVDHVKIIGTVVGAEEAKGIVILDTVNQLSNKSDLSSRYLLGLLLSRLTNWYVYRFIFAKAIRTMHFDGPVSDRIPIRAINFANPAEKSRHDQLVALVERMLELHKQKQVTKSETTRERIEREIHVTDEQIDALVYELYGLTKEEIKIVEESAQ